MTVSATGTVTTERGERYLKQLWSHFGIEPERNQEGTQELDFLGTRVSAHVHPDRVAFEIADADAQDATDTSRVIRAIAVIEKHLVKFGHREGLVMKWSGSEAAETYERDREQILADLQRERERLRAEREAAAEETTPDAS